jgi:hypothetical protein
MLRPLRWRSHYIRGLMARSRAWRLIICAAFSALSAVATAQVPGAVVPAGRMVLPPAARGIYVWPYDWAVKKGDFDKALAIPGVDGVGVHLTWSEISPAVRKYDFTAMDRQLAVAHSRHLAVELAVSAGQGIPDWMFMPPPAGLGLQRLDFEITYHGGVEPCHKVSMPAPWDPKYQDAFADMLAQLSAHLRSTGYDRDVAVIKLTGINTLTEELALPNENPAESRNPNPCVTDSPRIWATAGYRPSLVIRAMRGIAASFQRSFPDKLVTLPIIVMGALPPIGEDGRPIPRFEAIELNNKLLDDLVRTAAQALPGHLVLQDCFLIGDMPADQRTVNLARANSLPTSWQTNIWFGKIGKGAACGGQGDSFLEKLQHPIACNEKSFLNLLHNGMYPQGGPGPSQNALFIEVFPSDVVDFPGAIKAAHDEWKR